MKTTMYHCPLNSVVDGFMQAAKKRKALGLCKDSAVRRFTRYSSEADCNKDVLAGNYETILSSKGNGRCK